MRCPSATRRLPVACNIGRARGEPKPEIVFGTRSGRLIALDAATGTPVAGFGENGIVNMKTPEVMGRHPARPIWHERAAGLL